MNTEYRNDFSRRVNAAKVIPARPRDRRIYLISHASFTEFDNEAKAKLSAGEISTLDYVNCRSLIGEAINGPRG